jgi:hypothetical protein
MTTKKEMPRLLISYDLRESNRTKENHKSICAQLTSLGAVQIQDSVWTVRTELSEAALLAQLQGNFGLTDRVLIAHIPAILSRRGINRVR